MTYRPSEIVAVLAVLNPISQAAATVTSGWVPISTFRKILAIIQTGVLGASATIDAKLQQATSSGGAGAKDITGKAITQLTKVGTDDNKQVLLEVDASQVDVAGGFGYVQLSLTVGVAASLISAIMLGFDGRYEPASVSNVASVKQVLY